MIGSDLLQQPIDINVTERDVLELSGADALCAFFARLGYDTSKRLVQQPDNLARDLQAEFPAIQGFSSRNIWYMRTFYETYASLPKLQPLAAEIGWTHNVMGDGCQPWLQEKGA